LVDKPKSPVGDGRGTEEVFEETFEDDFEGAPNIAAHYDKRGDKGRLRGDEISITASLQLHYSFITALTLHSFHSSWKDGREKSAPTGCVHL